MSAVSLPAIFRGKPLAIIIQVITHLTATQYTSLAGRFLFFYDFALTLSDEVNQIWYAPWSIVKIIFLFNRYMTAIFLLLGLYARGGIVESHSLTFCNAFLWYEAFYSAISYASLHWLVVLRVWTLWGQKRSMLVALFAMWLVCAIGSLLFTIFVILGSLPTSGAIGGFCAFIPPTSIISIAKLPNLMMDSILFGLVLIKMYVHHKKNVSTPVLTRLYRDGIAYFIVNASCALFAIFVWTFAPNTLNGLPSTFTLSISNIAAFRLVLSLRTTSQKIQSNSTQASPDDSVVANPRTFWTTTYGGDMFEDAAESAADSPADEFERRSGRKEMRESFIQYNEEPVYPQEHMRLGASGVQWNYQPPKEYIETDTDDLESRSSYSHHSHSSSYSSPSSILNEPIPSPARPAITLPPLSLRFRNEYLAQRTENGMMVERSPETAFSSPSSGSKGGSYRAGGGSLARGESVQEGPDRKLVGLYSPFNMVQREERERERKRASAGRISWAGSMDEREDEHVGGADPSGVSPISASTSPQSLGSQQLLLDQFTESGSSAPLPRVALPAYRPKRNVSHR